MFDLKQLQCFIAVGEELHFGRAAKRLHMTQPPLSRQIQLLEFELQARLLERTSRVVRLTPAGKVFLREAVHLLALAQSATLSAQRVAQGDAGVIRLGFTAGSSYSFLPKLLTLTSESLKDVQVVLTEMVSRQQVEALHARAIDIGLQRSPQPADGLERLRVAREKMILAIPRHHPLARGRLPKLADLAGEPFITFSPIDGYYFYQLIDGLFTRASITPRYVQQISQIHSILALVSAGMGIALVPESAQALHFGGIALRQLKDETVYADLHLVWRKDNDNPALPIFTSLARRHLAVIERSTS
jgi:DNA-binding transcriptional LysR family regulator